VRLARLGGALLGLGLEAGVALHAASEPSKPTRPPSPIAKTGAPDHAGGLDLAKATLAVR
jgi:hypothetical protein